jgi:GAF domain-containing protein
MEIKIQNAINSMALHKDKTGKDYRRFLMTEICKLTGSTLSYIASVNAAQNELTMIGWSMSAMMVCTMMDKPLLYKLENTGLWGDAIRERKPVFTNDYPNLVKATKKGYPAGHVNIKRHMNLPIIINGKVVLVVGVGNKKEEYNEQDSNNIELFIKNIWEDLEKKI